MHAIQHNSPLMQGNEEILQATPGRNASAEDTPHTPLMRGVLRHELLAVFEHADHPGGGNILVMRPGTNEVAFPFFSLLPLNVPVEKLVEDVLNLPQCTDKVIVCALVLLERTEKRDPRLKISAHTVVRLFIAAIIVATKATNRYKPEDTEHIRTKYWGPTQDVMWKVEFAMLELLNCNAVVTDQEYRERLQVVFNRIEFVPRV